MSSAPASILIVTDTLQAGGAERAIADMANYWADTGSAITVLSIKSTTVPDFYRLADRVGRESLTAEDTPASTLAKIPRSIGRVRQLRSAFRRIAPDAILSFMDVPNILSVAATRGLPTRLIISERACPDVVALQPELAGQFALAGHWRFLRRRLYRHADVVTALNAETAEWLERECRTKVTVVPNAIRPMPDIESPRENTVVGIGRHHRVKGFDILLDAFARISTKHPDWALTLIGDGPESNALRQQAEASSVTENVTFVPTRAAIEPWMARAGIVVSPSRFEAFGNVVLESMAMGAPLISSDCAGPRSMINDGVNGILVPVGDAGALAAAIDRLIDNPTMRKHLGEEARCVREDFSQADIMSHWNELLRP